MLIQILDAFHGRQDFDVNIGSMRYLSHVRAVSNYFNFQSKGIVLFKGWGVNNISKLIVL